MKKFNMNHLTYKCGEKSETGSKSIVTGTFICKGGVE